MTERLGFIGGGQLGQMLTKEALAMDFAVTVVDPALNCPAFQVGAEQIQARLNDPEALRDLVRQVKVTTFEIEHCDTGTLIDLAAEGNVIAPHPDTVALIQDKLRQKEHLTRRGVPVAEFCSVATEADFMEATERFGEVIVKSRRGGYDGRGNLVAGNRSWAEISAHFGVESAQEALYAERIIPFARELSVVAAQDMTGGIALYPTVETVHKDNICHVVRAPAQIDPSINRDAHEIAYETVRSFWGAGVFAVEMFLTANDELLVNEVAPRVHNSGHWTIEGSETSQFRQHILAVTGQRLGGTALTTPAAVMVNVLGRTDEPEAGVAAARMLQEASEQLGVHGHWYGKQPRMDRKLGHITVCRETVEEAERIGLAVRELLPV